MKRILVITIAMLLLFCSCKKPPDTPPDDGQVINTGKTETYIVTGMNAELSIQGRENPWGNSRFEDEDAVKEKSVEFLGVTYAGTYERSYTNEYHSYVTEYYWTEDRIEFGFKAGTEELVHLNVMNSAFFDTEPLLQEKEAPRDYAVEKAGEIAALWIDPTAYEVEVEVKDTTSRIEDVEYAWSYYYVTFIKYINGLKTTDFITVRITSKGNLASLVVGDLGAFDEFEKTDILKKLGDTKYTIQRSKGLGENEPEMMSKTTMNPATRRLISINEADPATTEWIFDTLLGENLDERKRFITEHGSEYMKDIDV